MKVFFHSVISLVLVSKNKCTDLVFSCHITKHSFDYCIKNGKVSVVLEHLAGLDKRDSTAMLMFRHSTLF